MIITHQQCRAARELLDWSRKDLCQNTQIGSSTIAEFERGERDLRLSTLKKLVSTFEDAGIVFIDGNDESGVKISKKTK